jgi:enoyl-[acyl-carrier protein] reductase II
MLKTRMTEMFGIQHPIMLAGMNWVTEPKLVAAVCDAGGLGTLAIAQYSPDDTRKAIRQVRELTDKPFMVNQILVGAWVRENINVALEEKVPFINYSLGRPWFVGQAHAYGGKVIGTIAVARHAVRAVEMGIDGVIVTGHEAAAHGAETTSLVLLPLVASLVNVPVIAAGGFQDGRGLAAALALGADGISMGSRFLLTQESGVHDRFKQLCLKATEQDTLYGTAFDGMPGRVLKTKMAEKLMKGESFGPLKAVPNALKVKRILKLSWRQFAGTAFKMMRAEEARGLLQQAAMASAAVRQQKAIYDGNEEEGVMFAGQAIGAINDLPTVKEVIDRTVAEAEETLEKTRHKVVS